MAVRNKRRPTKRIEEVLPEEVARARVQPEDLGHLYRKEGFDPDQGRFLAQEEAATARLMAFYKQARIEMMTFLNGRGDPTPNDTAYYEELMNGVTASVQNLEAGAREWIDGTIPQAFVEGARTQDPRIGFTVLHDQALQALSENTLGLIVNTNEGIRRSVQQTVAAGILEGLSANELFRRMEAGGLQPGPWKTVEERAGVIARTETMRSYNAGNIVGAQSSGAPFVEWITSDDEAVCPICGPRDGVKYRTPGFEPSRLGVEGEAGPPMPVTQPKPQPPEPPRIPIAEDVALQQLAQTEGVRPFSAAAVVTLSAVEQDIVRNADFETLVLVNPETGERISSTPGQQFSVAITPEMEAVMPGMILTHNHPFGHSMPPGSPQWAGSSFSDSDLMSFLDTNLNAVRAVGPGWVHTLSTPDGKKNRDPNDTLIPPGEDFDIFKDYPSPASLHRTINSQVRAEYQAKIASGEVTTAQASADHYHEVTKRWVEEMNKYGAELTYTREMVPEAWDTSPREVARRPATYPGGFNAPEPPGGHGTIPPGFAEVKPARTWADTDEGWKAANKYGTETWGDTIESMGGVERNTLSQYSASGYKVVNNTLRGVPVPDFMAKAVPQAAGWIANLDQAVSRKPVPEDLVVSRSTRSLPFGVSADDFEKIVGRSFTDDGFYSTSLGPPRGGAVIYPTTYKIKVPRGTAGVYIASESASPEENELLLDRGLEFKITGARKTGDRTGVGDHEIVEVEMEVVPGSGVNAKRSLGETVASYPKATVSTPRDFGEDRNAAHAYGVETWGDYTTSMSFKPTGIYADMTPIEVTRLSDYSQQDYNLVNGYLRKTGTPGWLRRDAESAAPPRIAAIDTALRRKKVPEELMVTRTTFELPFGLGRDEVEKMVGKSFTDPGFYSTTIGKPTDGWNEYPVHYKIKVPKGTAAAYIAPVSGSMNEHELLLDRGLQFKVVGARKTDFANNRGEDIVEVDLEVIPGTGANSGQ